METVSNHLAVVYNEHLKYSDIFGRTNVTSRTYKEYCAATCPFPPETGKSKTLRSRVV
jgi:hypothetical protein